MTTFGPSQVQLWLRHVSSASPCSLRPFADTVADPAELKALEVAIRSAALERSIERSQLLARAAEARLLRTQRRAAAGIKSKVSTRPVLAVLTIPGMHACSSVSEDVQHVK